MTRHLPYEHHQIPALTRPAHPNHHPSSIPINSARAAHTREWQYARPAAVLVTSDLARVTPAAATGSGRPEAALSDVFGHVAQTQHGATSVPSVLTVHRVEVARALVMGFLAERNQLGAPLQRDATDTTVSHCYW